MAEIMVHRRDRDMDRMTEQSMPSPTDRESDSYTVSHTQEAWCVFPPPSSSKGVKLASHTSSYDTNEGNKRQGGGAVGWWYGGVCREYRCVVLHAVCCKMRGVRRMGCARGYEVYAVRSVLSASGHRPYNTHCYTAYAAIHASPSFLCRRARMRERESKGAAAGVCGVYGENGATCNRKKEEEPRGVILSQIQ